MIDWDEIEDPKKCQEDVTLKSINILVETTNIKNINVLFEGSTEIKYYIQGFENNNYTELKNNTFRLL